MEASPFGIVVSPACDGLLCREINSSPILEGRPEWTTVAGQALDGVLCSVDSTQQEEIMVEFTGYEAQHKMLSHRRIFLTGRGGVP